MQFPRLHNGCCCCTLETGTKVIATLQIIGTIVIICMSSVIAGYFSDPTQFPGLEGPVRILYGTYIAIAIIYSIELLFAILLLVGVFTNRPGLLVPWLIYVGVVILLTLVTMIINIIQSVATGIIISVVYSTISICLNIYFFLVVYSQYRNMVEGNPGGMPYGARGTV